MPLKVHTSFEKLLKMVIDTSPKKKKAQGTTSDSTPFKKKRKDK